MGRYPALKGEGKLFYFLFFLVKIKKKITARARGRAARARGGDEATTFTAVEPPRPPR
jgi:hypothetical protein